VVKASIIAGLLFVSLEVATCQEQRRTQESDASQSAVKIMLRTERKRLSSWRFRNCEFRP